MSTLGERAARVRVQPGGRAEIGWLNMAIAKLIGRVTGGDGPPNLFTTLARHRGLYRPWLRFAGALMPGGAMPRRDTELVILRVAHNCGCEYELRHHRQLAAEAGLSAIQIAGAETAPVDGEVKTDLRPGWSERQTALLEAADRLHQDRVIPDPLWASLERLLSETERIELCMLVGHYEMLAMTLNSLGVEPDAPGRPTRLSRTLARLAQRREKRRGRP